MQQDTNTDPAGAAGERATIGSVLGDLIAALVCAGAGLVIGTALYIGLNWVLGLIFGTIGMARIDSVWQIVALVFGIVAVTAILHPRFRAPIAAYIGRYYRFAGNFAGLLIGLFAVAIATDLFMRLLRVGNLPGMQEIIEYTLYFAIFLCAPWLLRTGAHVRVDLVLSSVPKPVARGMEVMLDLIGILMCLTLGYYAASSAIDAYFSNSYERKWFTVSNAFLRSFLIVSFTFLTLEFIYRLLRLPDPEKEARAGSQGGF